MEICNEDISEESKNVKDDETENIDDVNESEISAAAINSAAEENTEHIDAVTVISEKNPEEEPQKSEAELISIKPADILTDENLIKEVPKISKPEETLPSQSMQNEVVKLQPPQPLYPHLQAEKKEKLIETQSMQLPSIRERPSVPKEQSRSELMQPLTENQLISFYYNSELEYCEQFEETFVEVSAEIFFFELFETIIYFSIRQVELKVPDSDWAHLLRSYCDACRQIQAVELQKSDLVKQLDTVKDALWNFKNKTVKQKVRFFESICKNYIFILQGKCGEGKPATGSASYQEAQKNEEAFKRLQSNLEQYRDLIFTKRASFLCKTQTFELLCDSFVNELSNDVIKGFQIHPGAPVLIIFNVANCVGSGSFQNRILDCLRVLFFHLRQPNLPQIFDKNVRKWISKLISVLLRCARIEDHFFILNHLLRSPPGTAEWLANAIQPNAIPSESVPFRQLCDHFVGFLSFLMNPVRKRDEFMSDFIREEMKKIDASWAMVTEEGDELVDENHILHVGEADLLVILNQFSFDQLFAWILESFRGKENRLNAI